MLVLAIDTATPAVTAGLVALDVTAGLVALDGTAGLVALDGTAGLVRLDGTDVRVLASRVHIDARAHAEVLTPQILACLAESGTARADLDAVVVGVGPGPFTGLRVGIATAAAFADALAIPVHGVCSLDAIASDAQRRDDGRELLVVADARRREVYWARYRDGRRIDGPGVCRPADLDIGAAAMIAGSSSHVELFDLPAAEVQTPSPAALVRVAAVALRSGQEPEPPAPLYLRRPDAVERATVVR
ncbi:MAG TPA: tRNA (adenosine(37)-N6)-threonylcarbamoyltransferase complex dimerization subunit type 1 TsaB [Aldersonia sp.]